DTLRHFDELAPAGVRFDFAKGEIASPNATAAKPAAQSSGAISFLEKNIQVLLTLDEKSFEGGKHGASHPIAWRQDFEGGRSFYTALGHTIEAYSDEKFLKHLLGGIRDAIGKGKLDYSKAKTQRIPPEDRFIRTVLAENLDEPTELDVFPDGKVIFVERKGAIKIYDPETDTVVTVCHFPVYHAEEEGLMGVALDPGWEKNRWIYLYYSLDDAGGRRNRLSRFEFFDNILHLATEKMMLEVPELYGCCHTGGSIAFDAKGNLFLSTGDNTNPFESDGFAPMDERPGRALWDAQKSSANANDLRGKILRIKPQADGTYTIPEGNLFPKGTPGTRPEIFVMGCRNPYRISVDSKTGCVFWGDVGPDAGRNRFQRGPKGYDTFNRACEPGNYGWPLVRGNHVYFDYNFSTQKATAQFDALHPVNDSPNNTGIQELPPVQPPLIWYSYDESLEFPWVSTGGKNPMAGPIFHAADFVSPNSSLAKASAELEFGGTFPEYFEDKLFIYEWMRNWIYVVTLDSAGNFVQADPFLPSQKFSRPMDMAFGKAGALYVLEYGEQWFAANPDARLNKIEYAPGNRKPVPHIHASKTIGAEPLAVHFSADSTLDYDHDSLTFNWTIQGASFRTGGVKFDYTFNFPGKYEVVLKATDSHGAVSRATKEIVVGNEPPALAWEISGNQTFFWDDENLRYRLKASDLEDG
ncbi:MAG: PQQ-dependent sugar dehydrogenase, partial [Bacteroidota bacterium]